MFGLQTALLFLVGGMLGCRVSLWLKHSPGPCDGIVRERQQHQLAFSLDK